MFNTVMNLLQTSLSRRIHEVAMTSGRARTVHVIDARAWQLI